MVINDVLNEARELLRNANVEPREARLLLAYSMGILSDDLIKKVECSNEEYDKFMSCVNRRIQGEPFAYIVGCKEFMKLKFEVNKSVLIPRDDTEILVQEAIKINRNKILDMCTGSGCIAISLAKYIEGALVDAVDISKDAIEVAKKNASLNHVNVNFINSNLFENVNGKYDLIISNPPYIPSEDIDNLQIEVKNEPKLALDGGKDGLYFYKKISESSKEYLNECGVLMFEIGFDEAKDVTDILLKDGYEDIRVIKDLGGNDRVIIAKKGE